MGLVARKEEVHIVHPETTKGSGVIAKRPAPIALPNSCAA